MKQDEFIPSIIEQADMQQKVQAAQDLAAIKNAAKRHQERMAIYKAWVDPKAIAERKERHEKEAAAALERGKSMGRPQDDEPIPADLPPHMRGQSPSTIRAMLKHERSRAMDKAMLEIKEPTIPLARVIQAPIKPKRWYQQLIAWLKSVDP